MTINANSFKAKIQTPDGVLHDTKQEALDHMRKPEILASLGKISGINADLAKWLLEQQEGVEAAFETGQIRRVTKSEAGKLAKALEALKKLENVPGIAFLQENAGAIQDSFRWPAVKRMTDDEKKVAARNTLVVLSEGNEELATYILANKDAILAAYQAGVVKREVSPNASNALAAYRAKKLADDRAKAEAAGPEALAAFEANLAAKEAAKAGTPAAV